MTGCFIGKEDNYGYAFLEREVRLAIIGAQLDARIGFLHTNNGRKDSLVFDLMEPFRQSVIDRLVLKSINLGQFKVDDFADEIKEQADYYAHTEEGKAEIQEAAKQAGRAACETGKFIWAVAGGIVNGITQKTKNCYKAGRHMYHGEYMEAGKTIADMDKAIGKTLH